MDGDLRPLASAYLGFVAGAGLAAALALWLTDPRPGAGIAVIAAILAGLLALAFRFPLSFAGHARVSLDTAVLFAVVLVLPPGLAVTAAGVGPLLAAIRGRTDRSEVVFNAGQVALQATAGVVVVRAFGLPVERDPFDDPRFLLVVPLAAVTLYLVNTLLVAGMMALQARRPYVASWRTIALSLSRTERLAHLAQVGLGMLAVVILGHHAWAIVLLVLPAAATYSAIAHSTDLRPRAEDRVVHQAFHDALTGLPNRVRLMERLDQAIERADETGAELALLFLDLDHFKLINDSLGHAAGDRLLVTVAERLRAAVRPHDLVARQGGDEFVVLLASVDDPCLAEQIAERIGEMMTAPVDVGERSIVVSTSIGIVRRTSAQRTAGDLLRDADIALYRAKESGRARAAVFTAAMGEETRARVTLETELRVALARDEFVLEFQPELELETGRVVALEALCRWDHPTRGRLTPVAFLAVAE